MSAIRQQHQGEDLAGKLPQIGPASDFPFARRKATSLLVEQLMVETPSCLLAH
jgi:hypothetical protein